MPIQRPQPDLSALIDQRCGVLPLSVLHDAGVSRGRRRAMVAAERWRIVPGKGVVTSPVATNGEAEWREALLAVGPGARLGGMTALESDGLKGYVEPLTHIWVPKGHEKQRLPGVRLHETRRWSAKDATCIGLPRARPAVATVQGALWAVSLRQAMLCMVMPIQQELVRADDVAVAFEPIKRHRFRKPLLAGLRDISLGAESLNELDFAVACRRRNLPEPTRQVVRQISQGKAVLDVFWEDYCVVVEVNGAGHNALDVAMRDEVRIADLQAQGNAVIPLSVLTLRCDPDPLFAALAELLRARGWQG